MACVNTDYEFIWVDVDTNGCISNGCVLKNTAFLKKLNSDQLNIPPPEPNLDDVMINLFYVFVG